jgi:hypothetical protein
VTWATLCWLLTGLAAIFYVPVPFTFRQKAACILAGRVWLPKPITTYLLSANLINVSKKKKKKKKTYLL